MGSSQLPQNLPTFPGHPLAAGRSLRLVAKGCLFAVGMTDGYLKAGITSLPNSRMEFFTISSGILPISWLVQKMS